MMLEGRKTLVWGTIAAAVFSALWLGATDGSLPRLSAGPSSAADARAHPVRMLESNSPTLGPPSRAH